MSIFNLALAPLYVAIAQVESDRGATSDNVYQIREIYVADVNRIMGSERFAYSDVFSPIRSESMMLIYWSYYGVRYRDITGRNPTYEALARMHNGGPDGWRKDSTLAYWKRVEAALKEAK